MNKEIKNTKVEIVRTKNIPRRDNDHVLFNFSKFHNNNIIGILNVPPTFMKIGW